MYLFFFGKLVFEYFFDFRQQHPFFVASCHYISAFEIRSSGGYILFRAAGTGQAGQAKAGPLFLYSPLYGIDRQIIVLGNDRQACISSISVC